MIARRGRAVAIIVALTAGSASFTHAAVAAKPKAPPKQPARPDKPHKDVCSHGAPSVARCHARIVTKADAATPEATTAPSAGAYIPTDLRSAYAVPAAPAGAGQTIAIVDAYDNPYAETDLAAYRSRFGIPPCTTANGCFRKVNQDGQPGPYPAGNVGWGQEIALDLDMASAVCPSCNLLLVEATSNNFSDLGVAVDRAALMGANTISNSYGAREFAGETSYESHYRHPGVAITVSSGDNGYGAEFPSASQYVTSVGGTRLYRSSTARGWAETAWSGAGSGCSQYIPKPAWQHDAKCANRTIADVAAVADPNSGVAIYDSYGSAGGANWYVFGGTSVAAPIIASIYALGGSAQKLTYGDQPYAHTDALNDVTQGVNGSCGGTYLCIAGTGYDGPTGLGTPRGTGAFGGSDGSTGSTTTTSTSTTTTTTTLPPTTTTSTSTTTTAPATTTTTTAPATTRTTAPVSGQPSAPTSVGAAQAGSPGVLVSWHPPTARGCGAITGYRLYRSTSSGTETFLVAVAAQYTYQDTSATSGVRFYYKVSAVNACGEGPRSAEVTAVAR